MASGIVESSNQNQGSGQQQQQGTGKRSKLVERLLDASANLPAFMKDLLGTMAVTVAGTEAAGFLIERGQTEDQAGLRVVTHIRPDDSDDEIRTAAIKAFTEIIVPCIQQNKDGAIEVGTPDEGEPQFCLVTLLRNEGAAVAVAAVITRCRDQERARQRLMSMQLVAGYFELYMIRRHVEQSKELAVRHQNVLQLSTSVATAEGFEAAAMNFCNELSTRAGASRVSLGWMKGENIKVRALSHTEKFDKKQELIVKLQRVMEECLDQEEPVRFDADGTRSENVTREAESLLRTQGNSSVYSIPLRRRAEIVGIITLEFSPPAKLTDEVANALSVTSDLLAPQLWDRHENDRWIAVKMGHSIANATQVALGRKHVLAKLIIALVIGLGLFITFFQPMYHVSAPFQFVAAEKRTISSPYEGFLDRVYVKAGERFKKGQVLAELRTDDLESKRAKAAADFNSYNVTYLQKLADRNNPRSQSEAAYAKEQAAGAAADTKYYDFQISQSKMIAPFDGIVLKGDLDDKVGAPVKVGDPLMEIADMSQPLKAELAVPERDIHFIGEMPANAADRKLTDGWTGKLATNSLPGQDIKFKIDRIVPLGDAKDAENTFKVYAVLEEQPGFIRPGMAGEARIDAGHKRLAWIWTHRLVDFLRLKLWM
ncbi:MAG: HlyD family secretion protein [Phycisphaerales bacterium]|nr:HlyD family secretion protein [Phycisphaerales bacterium]